MEAATEGEGEGRRAGNHEVGKKGKELELEFTVLMGGRGKGLEKNK